MLPLKEILKSKSHEHPDTTDMPELESEESAGQRRNLPAGSSLKILTPDQMLSRLPITFAQLKAGNNSQKLINEMRQLLDNSFYGSKRTNQNNLQPFNQRYIKMETIFMNTENSKTNEPHKFRLSLSDKLNLKNRKKNIA